jgi:hypothetical protein
MNSITTSENDERPLAVGVKRAIQMSELSRTTLYALMASGALKSKPVAGRRLIDFRSLASLVSAEGP